MYRLLIIFLVTGLSSLAKSKPIHKERSLYRNVVVSDYDNLRCMHFESRRKAVTHQSCINPNSPDELVFEYLKGTIAAFALKPKPKNVLIIGLGGGVLSNAITRISPETKVTNVDIDPVVVKVARQYFFYRESDKVKTIIKDGRVVIKKAIINNEKFDWVILDAFNSKYVPEHLMTREFFTEVKQVLAPGGILTANTYSNGKLYDSETATYNDVFKQLFYYNTPTNGNRIIYACNCDEFNEFPSPTPEIDAALRMNKVEFEKIIPHITNHATWNRGARILTDQYSPANLIRNASRP